MTSTAFDPNLTNDEVETARGAWSALREEQATLTSQLPALESREKRAKDRLAQLGRVYQPAARAAIKDETEAELRECTAVRQRMADLPKLVQEARTAVDRARARAQQQHTPAKASALARLPDELDRLAELLRQAAAEVRAMNAASSNGDKGAP